MLSILFSWLIIIFIFYTFGDLTLKFLISVFKFPQHQGLFDKLITGMLSIFIITNIISLFCPVNAILLCVYLFISLIYFFINSNKIVKILMVSFWSTLISNYRKAILISLIFLAVLLAAALPAMEYDSSLYHFQAIQWIEKFSAVPGLANLHGRFGFNSGVLMLSALFSMRPFFEQPVFALNSLFLFLFLFWIIKNHLFSGGFSSLFCAAILAGTVYYYLFIISSPSTDFLPNLFIIYICTKYCLMGNTEEDSSLVYLLFPLLCVILKISALPIIVISLLFLFKNRFAFLKTNFTIFLIFSILLFVPWMIRNEIQTGYLIYPVSQIDFFNPDWKVPLQKTIEEAGWIKSWARIPRNDYQKVIDLGFFEWIPWWWKFQGKVASVLISANLISLLSLVVLYIRTKTIQPYRHAFVASLISAIGLAFWLFTAPDLRFGFGFLIIGACIASLLFLTHYFSVLNIIPKYFMFIFIFFIATTSTYRIISKIKKISPDITFTTLLIKPISSRIFANERFTINSNFVFKYKLLNQYKIHYPEHGDLCFDDYFPCVPKVSEHLQLRGKTLQDGFKYIP